jgi:beta-1,4-N-acetylglucosaminyltransferase
MLQRAPLDPTLYTHRTYVVSSGDSFSAQKAVEFEQSLLLRTGREGKDERTTYGGDAAADIGPASSDDPKSRSDRTPTAEAYTIVTVPRARRIHQSLLTAPFSTLQCIWACLCVLRGKVQGQRAHPTYPDLILTNGPATAVCVILAARLLRLLNPTIGPHPQTQEGERNHSIQEPPTAEPLRTIFIESWARVTSLSLSGKIVLPLVDRFLVQWAGLEGKAGWDADLMIMGLGAAPKRAEFVGALVA